MIEPIYEKVNYCQKKVEIKEQINLSAKSNVNCQEIERVLCLSPSVVIDSSEVLQGKIKYSGKINFYVCYLDKQNTIKKCECASEFNGQILNDLLEEDQKVLFSARVEKASEQLNGSFLILDAVVELQASCFNQLEQNALSGGQNLLVEQGDIEIEKGLGVKRGSHLVQEKFELSYPVEQVMFHQASAVISSVQSGVGCIIVEGQALLSLVLLQKNQKKDIIKVCKSLPFRTEIECEECMPNLKSVAFVKEKAIKTDIEVDENSNVSTVEVSLPLLFEGQTYLTQTLTVAKDAFCTTHHLDLETCVAHDFRAEQTATLNFTLNGRCGVSELAPSTNVLATAQESVIVLSHAIQGEKMTVNGVYSALAFLVDGQGTVFSRRLETPFERVVDINCLAGQEYLFIAKAFRGSAKIISLTEIEIDCEIFINVYPSSKCKLEFISSATEGQIKEQKGSAISVYVAKGGEGLFSLAKSLNVCPQDLAITNQDLNFPLEGNERIVIYRQIQ